MSGDLRTRVNGNGDKQVAVPNAPDDDINVRLPELFMMMTADGEYNGKASEGKIGLKIGKEWCWLSYTSMKKMIDLCLEHKVLFNEQLRKEIEKLQVSSL